MSRFDSVAMELTSSIELMSLNKIYWTKVLSIKSDLSDWFMSFPIKIISGKSRCNRI